MKPSDCEQRDERPLVLTQPVKGALRLASVGKEALPLGLTPGLTLADARARIPDLAAVEHDPGADDALLKLMAEDCERWTPLVALDPPHGLALDITGCAHLFGGEAALRECVLRRFRRAGFTTNATVAGTPDAARALARFGRAAIVPLGGEAAAAATLPVAALELPEEAQVALRRAGLKRLADLMNRPSSPLVARFGDGLTTRLDRVTGREDRRIVPLRALPSCFVEQVFPEPLLDPDDILRVLAQLAECAAKALAERGEGGRVFEASFFPSNGGVRRIQVETGRPSRDAKSILRLFRERLDAAAIPLDPGAGFDGVRLAVPVTEPLGALQPRLDGKALEEDEVASLIDRLAARLGAARVLRFVAVDTHDPVRAAKLVPAMAMPPNAAAWPEAEPGEPPLRPLQLFEPPQPVEAVAEVPDGPPAGFRWRKIFHQVTRAEGPERIEPEWWRDPGQPARDYYRVEDSYGRRFWLFRTGFYGEASGPRWFLHGLFA
jgi:protein ImuB